MGFKELDTEKKVFLLIALPIFIFLGFFLSIFYVQVSVFFAFIMGIGFASFVRREQLPMRLTKVAIFSFVIYIIMFYNVTQLPSQIVRHLPGQRNELLEPENEHIAEFKEDFYDWHESKYNLSFTALPEDNEAQQELKLLRIDYYIRQVRMEYTYDTNPPYFYYDHLPTIDEIFQSDSDGDGKLQDDCDGITILTVSLLLNMGYDAWVAEVEYHYHTMVFLEGADPKTKEGYKDAIIIYNSRSKPAYMIFNDEESLIPPGRPLIMSIGEILTGASMYENYFLGFFHGKYFTIPFLLMIPIAYIITILLSGLIIFFHQIGRNLNFTNRNHKRGIIRLIGQNSLIVSFGLFLLYLVASVGLGGLGNFILAITLISSFRYSDYELGKIKRNESRFK